MQNILLPSKVNFEKGKNKNEAIINIQPCSPGYGITIGNALRRVLLSSIAGTAVTAFKIKNVPHEFSTLPYIKEDLIEISLNLKLLRLKILTPEPVRLTLKVKGEKKVTAKDIKVPSNVKIANPDLLIATLTSAEAELDMELLVSQGRGYLPTEDMIKKEDLEVGMITIDAIFTPIKNVGFRIENIRVDQMTNYENLIINLETDGTITPQEALNQATKILLDHFNFVDQQTQKGKEETKVDVDEKKEEEEKKLKVEKKEEKPLVEIQDEKEKKPKKRGRPRKTEVKKEEDKK